IHFTPQKVLNAVLTDLNLKKIYSLFVRENVASILPNLKDSEISGVADVKMRLKMDNSVSQIVSIVKLRGVDVKIPKLSLDAGGIDVDLPISLGKDIEDNSSTQGHLDIRDLTLAFLKTSDIRATLTSQANRISSQKPVFIKLLNGEVRLDDISIDFSTGLPPKTRFSLDISNLDISDMRQALGLQNARGLINGKIEVTSVEKNRFMTQGNLNMDIFGGLVKVKDPYGDFAFKNIGADVEMHNIDLEKLTETLRFGKITGIVNGTIKDLLIQYGQAARFKLDIYSVKREGVKQTVSTDAVQNISILGTGSEGISRLLSTGLNQFFKEFPYSAIGIHCSLDNDVFMIRGNIREGGKEYLIRKAFLRGIDVINQNPENTISFKEMQRRLSAIFDNMRARSND
ncbi:MAG: hypothetical protein SNJ53_06085, partial [Thermodesulfovibrionales bacterium]